MTIWRLIKILTGISLIIFLWKLYTLYQTSSTAEVMIDTASNEVVQPDGITDECLEDAISEATDAAIDAAIE